MAGDYLWIEGIPFHRFIIENLSSLRDEFVVRDEDVIILSYPKSGTLWMTEIVNLICNKGDPAWVQSVVSSEPSMWLETKAGLQRIKDQKDPRILRLPSPHSVVPQVILQFQGQGELMMQGQFGMRNPRDVITSGYHFWKMVKIIREPESFEEYSEWFLQGNGEFDSKCGLQVEWESFCVSSPGLTVP
eukprot:bmy_21377T0